MKKEFRRACLCGLAALWALAPCALRAADPLSLDSLLSSHSAGQEQMSGPGFFGIPEVTGQDLASALGKIRAERLPGVRALRTGSGMAFEATGAAPYSRDGDYNRSRMMLRRAYTAALMDAKRRLAAAMKGLPAEARTELYRQSQDSIGGDGTKQSSSERLTERMEAHLETMLSGAVTSEVFDNGSDMVTVSVITSPVTRGAMKAISGGVLSTDDLERGLKLIRNDLQKEVLPPNGARLVLVPGTDQRAILAYGSAIVPADRQGKFPSQDRLTAQRRSEAQAAASMIAFLQGESFLWKYGYHSTAETQSANYEKILQDGVEVDRLLEKTRTDFISSVKDTATASAAVRGTLPPGTQSESFITADGWCFTVLICRPELQAWTEDPAKTPSQAVTPPPASQPDAEKADPRAFDDLKSLRLDDAAISSIDWEKGVAELSGQGAAPSRAKGAKARLLARRAAQADLQRRFAEFLHGASVAASTRSADFEVSSDSVSSAVSGVVKNIKTVDESWDGSFYTVTGQMELKDLQAFLAQFRRK